MLHATPSQGSSRYEADACDSLKPDAGLHDEPWHVFHGDGDPVALQRSRGASERHDRPCEWIGVGRMRDARGQVRR